MWFSFWLRTGKRSEPVRHRRPHGSARQRAGFRPRLEVLEDRCVPSTLWVTSPLDDAHVAGTLRYDIAHARSGDAIEMSPTLQGAPIVLSQGELLLKTSLTIAGSPGQPETISGNYNSRVFEVAAKVSVTLTYLNITGGNGVANNPGGATGNAGGGGGSSGNDGHGGGILNFGTVKVSNCTLSGNSVNDASAYVCEGGAIANIAGTVNVSNCTLSGNSVAGGIGGGDSGGAIANIGDAATATVATLTVSNSILSGNSAAHDGGAIFNYVDGTVTLSNSTLSHNSAASEGGAIWTRDSGFVTVGNSTLSGNSAGVGGAIYNVGGAYALTVSDSVFSGNSPGNIDGLYTDGGGNTGLP